ncbi:MAG: sodium-independent anion transporter [Clostridia bacterium]|nr:sodium-independent anion transporter [Clostridia bacterium]
MKLFEPKILTAFRNYKSKDYIADVVAGVIVAIIALPLSIALAIASGATPETGLFTAIIAGFITALLGGSKVNITGPTAAFATIVAGIILTQGMDGLFLATIMAGILLILMGVLRLGSLIKYIPHTITVGFTAGIAVTLVIGQLKDFLGLTYPTGVVAIETIEKLTLVFEHIFTFNPWAFALGVLGLAILILWPKISKKIPGSLIAVLVGSLVCLIPFINANTIGSLYTISSALPSFKLPAITLEKILALLPSAFTIALLAGIESLLSCVVSDKMVDDTHNSNTELIALGTSNIFVGCFGGIPATGAIARTAANVKNGGRSPLSGMIHAVVLLLVLVVLMPLAAYIPMPIIAAILFIVAYNMSEWREFVAVVKTKKWNDILVLILTFALTVIFDLVKAIAVGLILHYAILLAYSIREKRKAKKEKEQE